MELINKNAESVPVEKVHLYNGYAAQNMGLSTHRQAAFEGFIRIHLVLLPAHAAVVTKFPGTGNIYSILVAILGISICIVSYNRIRSIFTRIEAGYDMLCKIEEQDFPYRFYTALGEEMKRSASGRKTMLRRTELVFHWIVGFMYASLPFIPKVENILRALGLG